MKDQKKAESIASERVQLLAPLLAEGLDAARASEIKTQICTETGISERTLRRYLAAYRSEDFGGLQPKGKGRQPSEDTIAPHVLEQAILLRREVPSRSVSQLIQILEWEGRIAPGSVKRSTLQERLAARGYSTRHMRMYAESGVAARRFQQRHRNRLWHSDLKYGPYLPIGPGGAMKQVFLVTFIDDATHFVLPGAFYPVMDAQSPMALILVGQSELWDRLGLQAYAAIRQRIDLQCKLAHFDRVQTGAYIVRHMTYAGAEHDVFTEAAIDDVFRFSSGAARLINKVCTHSLIYGSQNKHRIVDDHMIKRVIQGELV
jgi:hypothetical protein